ncbi:MAG: carbohydrate ABC transporter permease [Halanaerobiales bacterium]|nr:carbohydrate ABC transporter permease [Halanaerobiales bacterium]
MKEDLMSLKRRRWANVGAIYLLLLLFSIIFIGPFLFGFLSSLKDDPTEWPPSLKINQLKFSNWVSIYKLGKLGGGGGFFGTFAPGSTIPFEITYEVSKGKEPVPPEVKIPKRLSGSAAVSLRTKYFAADYSKVSEVTEKNRVKLEDGSIRVTYEFTIYHIGDVEINRLPIDLTVPFKQNFVSATIEPNRIERLGRVQSWDNITSGVIPYIFNNYHRVFNDNYSRSTGKRLFLCWIGNSIFLSVVRVFTTLLFASMAGYALARLNFKGKNFIFVFMLFSMMIPG